MSRIVLTLTLAIAAMTSDSTSRTPASRASGGPVRFPAVSGRNLEGKEYALPRDFEGERNVVVVAFKREQQHDVASWTPALGELARTTPGVRVYGMPTLKASWRIMRGMIDGGMRRGTPDASEREHTITLYVDTDAFRKALAIPDDRQVHVLLVDRAGTVLWRTAGRYDAARMQSLSDEVSRALPSGGRTTR